MVHSALQYKKKNERKIEILNTLNFEAPISYLGRKKRSNSANTFITGTRLAMLRIIKTSPGWNPNMLEGHTLESAQAITINCTWIYQLKTTITNKLS